MLFIYSGSARLVSFEIKLFQKFRKLYPQSRSRKFAYAGSTIKGLYLSVFQSFIST